MNIKELAIEISNTIESKVRDNGQTFCVIDYDKSSYGQLLQSAIRRAHGKTLPDDYIYGVACDFIQALATDYDVESINEDLITEWSDNYTDIYNHDLLQWSVNHYEWVEDSIQEFGLPDTENFSFINLISAGQNYQINFIARNVFDFLESISGN